MFMVMPVDVVELTVTVRGKFNFTLRKTRQGGKILVYGIVQELAQGILELFILRRFLYHLFWVSRTTFQPKNNMNVKGSPPLGFNITKVVSDIAKYTSLYEVFQKRINKDMEEFSSCKWVCCNSLTSFFCVWVVTENLFQLFKINIFSGEKLDKWIMNVCRIKGEVFNAGSFGMDLPSQSLSTCVICSFVMPAICSA